MSLPIFALICLGGGLAVRATVCNDRPVVGVLAQDTYWSRFRNFGPEKRSYIAASYVKAIEASGGRVVPVFANRTAKYYEEVVSRVNGILIPGGSSSFDVSCGITRSTVEIINVSKRINRAKDHFPILGICLGFEMLLLATNDQKSPFTKCDSQNVNLPLNIIPEMEEKSVLFKAMPKNIRNILLSEPVTSNHHIKCLTYQTLTSTSLNKFWNPITTNKDSNNLTFISTIEAKDYPFVGLQFHPEKNAYEWEKNDPHSWSAIYSARYFYDWFVNECRKNKHEYTNKTALTNELIYNYNATFVGKPNFPFEQIYLFNE